MNRILNNKDYFLCSGGCSPAKMQHTQTVASKQDGTYYLTADDIKTQFYGDFVCQKAVYLAALVGALISVAFAATGGAALAMLATAAISGGATGGAVGLGIGLLCGIAAAYANFRSMWLLTIPNVAITSSQKKLITETSFLRCKMGGVVQYAPNIKTWWQALLVSGNNVVMALLKGVMVGAAMGALFTMPNIIATLTVWESIKLYLTHLTSNNLLLTTTKAGWALRSYLGLHAVVQGRYSTNTPPTLKADMANFITGVYVENQVYNSAARICTAQAGFADYALLTAFLMPVKPTASTQPARSREPGPYKVRVQNVKTGQWEEVPIRRIPSDTILSDFEEAWAGVKKGAPPQKMLNNELKDEDQTAPKIPKLDPSEVGMDGIPANTTAPEAPKTIPEKVLEARPQEWFNPKTKNWEAIPKGMRVAQNGGLIEITEPLRLDEDTAPVDRTVTLRIPKIPDVPDIPFLPQEFYAVTDPIPPPTPDAIVPIYEPQQMTGPISTVDSPRMDIVPKIEADAQNPTQTKAVNADPILASIFVVLQFSLRMKIEPPEDIRIPGHAFVILYDHSTDTYDVMDLFINADAKGNLILDWLGRQTATIIRYLTDEKYLRGKKFTSNQFAYYQIPLNLAQTSSLKHKLNDILSRYEGNFFHDTINNCVTFVCDVLRAAGIDVPSKLGKIEVRFPPELALKKSRSTLPDFKNWLDDFTQKGGATRVNVIAILRWLETKKKQVFNR